MAHGVLNDPNWPVHAKEALAPELPFSNWSAGAGRGLAMADALKKQVGLLPKE